MGRIIQRRTTKYKFRKSKVKTLSNKKHNHKNGNHKRCPSCGRFL